MSLRADKPSEYVERSQAAMAAHCEAMVDFQRGGAVVFDYGNGLRGQALDGGFADAFAYPGFVLAYIRPLFARGAGPFRWACLSGSDADLAATDEAVLEAFPDDDGLQRWVRFAAEKVSRAGAAVPDLLAGLRRAARRRGSGSTTWSDPARSTAPIVIGRDHLDAGSVASPERETEGMRDGSDAIADWPVLNALLNTASGRNLGVGAPRRRGRHRQVDPRRALWSSLTGRTSAARRLERVLTNDPGMGVLRHADAGYEIAERHRPRGRHPHTDGGRDARAVLAELARRGLRPALAVVRRRGRQPPDDEARGRHHDDRPQRVVGQP